MNTVGTNVKKLLPSLALGVLITLLAAAMNSMIYERRLPAMAVGNPIFARENRAGQPERRPPFTRILAGLVNLADNFATDAMFAARGSGNFPSTADRIAVVAIDEASILHKGSWPWSRRDIADLVAKLSDARVVGIDLLFPEPDPTSLVRYVSRFEDVYAAKLERPSVPPEELDNDLYLAEAISRTHAVLGFALHDGKGSGHRRVGGLKADYGLEVVTVAGKQVPPENALLRKGAQAVTDLAVIRNAVPAPAGEGYVNLFPERNGTVRAVPMMAHADDSAFSEPSGHARRVCPSLPLEVMRIALGGDGYRLILRGDVVNIPEFIDAQSRGDRYPVTGVSITGPGANGPVDLLKIPLDELGEMETALRHRRSDYQVFPAWEVLAGRHDGAFKDRLVLVGGTAPGVGFIVSGGLPDPNISLVEVHATLLSAMLKGDFMDSGYKDDYSWQQATILCSGLAVTLGIIFGNLGVGMFICGLALLFTTFGNYHLFFRNGMEVGVTLPFLSILAVLVVQVVTNYLVVGRERRFIRKAFQLNVSPSILGYLESHPDRLSSLQGENRNMTVLFTDIRGFTSISERMTAPDLARFLNEYFTPMSDIVMKNMGTVDKFIGDGLMAFWNAPADNPTHARDAARSALDMLEKLAELQPGWTSRGLPRVAIGCGINTGQMFAGYMGSEQRKNYTVMGDNVNIASRLEGLNKYYSANILITEATRKELGNEFTCRVVDKVRVSGKVSSVMIYELLGRGTVTDEEREELAAFARVFELYQMREFAMAESLLKELVFIRPTPLYKMYLDRLAIYKALPPPPDWDGTFAMAQK